MYCLLNDRVELLCARPRDFAKVLHVSFLDHVHAFGAAQNDTRAVKQLVAGFSRRAFYDRNCNVIAPFVAAPGNGNESPLLREALPLVTPIAREIGMSLQRTGLSRSNENILISTCLLYVRRIRVLTRIL
jgi:hypothetical protein